MARLVKLRPAALVLVALSSFHAAAQDVCKALLSGGVFNTYNRTTAMSNYSWNYQLLCSKESLTYSQTNKLASDAGINLVGIKASFGFSSEQSQHSDWRKAFCAEEKGQSDWRLWEKAATSEASSIIASKFVECAKNADGLIQTVASQDDSGLEFNWHFKFKRADIEEKKSIKIKLKPTSNIQCTQKTIQVKAAGEYPVQCKRLNCDSAVLSVESPRTAHPQSIKLLSIKELTYKPEPAPYTGNFAKYMNTAWEHQLGRDPKDVCEITQTTGSWCKYAYNDGRDCKTENSVSCATSPKLQIERGVAKSGDFDSIPGDNGAVFQCYYNYRCQPPSPPPTLEPPRQQCSTSGASTKKQK